MNKLTKEKKSQLALVLVVIAVIGTGLYMGLIRYQQGKIRALGVESVKAEKKVSQISETSRSSAKIEAELKAINGELATREGEMASDDLYAAVINTIRQFKLDYDVDIKQFSSKGIASMNLIPRFPYQQFTVSIMGSAHYHDIGKFIADFENRFQSARILNVEFTPDTQSSGGPEKLMFRMDVVSLVKAGESAPIKKP
jgi:Tfp pilus assembly protein PilO